jgi:hypothetical protein
MRAGIELSGKTRNASRRTQSSAAVYIPAFEFHRGEHWCECGHDSDTLSRRACPRFRVQPVGEAIDKAMLNMQVLNFRSQLQKLLCGASGLVDVRRVADRVRICLRWYDGAAG